MSSLRKRSNLSNGQKTCANHTSNLTLTSVFQPSVRQPQHQHLLLLQVDLETSGSVTFPCGRLPLPAPPLFRRLCSCLHHSSCSPLFHSSSPLFHPHFHCSCYSTIPVLSLQTPVEFALHIHGHEHHRSFKLFTIRILAGDTYCALLSMSIHLMFSASNHVQYKKSITSLSL